MTHILAAGDRFVSPELFVRALTDELGSIRFRTSTLDLPWPVEPFGPVAEVDEASGTEDQVIAALGDASVAVTQMAPFTRRVFAAAPNLSLVGVCRGGPVNVDLAAATAHGVTVTFAPGRNAQAAAEYAVGMILAAMRRIAAADAELARGNWRGDYYAYDNAGIELAGTAVGLVGYGAIGRIVARVLVAFGAKVSAADPYADPEQLRADGVALVALDELLRTSEVVSLHARLTADTRNLIDAHRLALLPPGAVFVNTARGGLVDHDALTAAVAGGRLGAVALDVYDVEPPDPQWTLLDHPLVVTTPHLAGATRQTAHRAAAIVAADVGRFLRGETLRHVANPDVVGRRP